MILDERSEIADATALSTAGTGRAIIGDVIDLGATPPDLGAGEPVEITIEITTAVTSAGAATVTFEVVSDAQAALATDGSATLHLASADIAKATLVAGYQVMVARLPAGTYERYLGVLQNVSTAALTAGAANINISMNVPRIKAYPDAAN